MANEKKDTVFYRKISKVIENHFISKNEKILLIDGARQIGKSYIIRQVGKKMFKNFIEINLYDDLNGPQRFKDIYNLDMFYLQLSTIAGDKLNNKQDTLIFLDEIQVYPQLLTMLKFLKEDNKYTYIASGSMLGIALKKSVSIPMGSILSVHMYPMDFEEFLLANGTTTNIVEKLKTAFDNKETLPTSVHNHFMLLFKYYLLCGGLPDAVKAFVEKQNVIEVRSIQNDIREKYSIDAAQYDDEHNLVIRKIYELLPSFMENVKKRIIVKEIDDNKNGRYRKYQNEFEYLTASGIALDVKAVPAPIFPLTQGMTKNLLKLYLNDVGILTSVLFGSNINPIINDTKSVNLGSVYETVVASELRAHGFDLYYYDNRKKGGVDFLIDDINNQSVLPIEIKSGKDYSTHAALNKLIDSSDYTISRAFVFSNEPEIHDDEKITYYPIYMIGMLQRNESNILNIKPIANIEEW